MLSEDALRKIADSAGVVHDDPAGFGRVFYRNLFASRPDLRGLFPADMERQAEILSQTLLALLCGLHDFDRLRPEILAMGRRHVAYGARPDHFDAVGAALLVSLRDLSGAWSTEHAAAWTALYHLVADLMIEAGLEDAAVG